MSDGPLTCGVDVGASATKLVLLDAQAAIRGRAVLPSGVDYDRTARQALAQALEQVGLSEGAVGATTATGYGRQNVSFAGRTVTEIHCHAAGSFHLVPRQITVVDIGGQDNKVIRLDGGGRRLDFKMNRKCAAGTGAFLEEIALRLDLPLGELDALARGTEEAVRLSSFCTVFAKTEILSHLRRGAPVAQVVRGAYQAVVQRVLEMAPLEGEVLLTGGVVAHHPTVAALLARQVSGPVGIAPEAQLVGALGAALHARSGEAG